MLLEASEYFMDMFAMIFGVVREDIIEIDNNSDVEKVSEDVIHETLKGCRCIG